MKKRIYRHQHKFYLKRKFDVMKNFIDYQKFWELVENEIKLFLKQPCSHYLVERAKNEKWFGSLHNNRDSRGLLGYLRTNYALQLKFINNFSNHVQMHCNDQLIINWFLSDYFKKTILNNPEKKVILNFYKDEHLEIIKNKENKFNN